MENLHHVPAVAAELETVRHFLWQGQVDAAIRAFDATEPEAARRFCGYLKHKSATS